MLKLLRQKGIQKKIYIGLAIVVVFTFVVSGIIVTQDEPGTSGTLAKFGGRKISVHEYLDNYRAVQRQASMMYGEKLNELASRMNFKGEAWDRILLLESAKRRNIRATDQEVVQWIAKQQSFQKDGKFDEAYYKTYIAQGYRGTPRQFEEEIRQMLTIGKVQEKAREEFNLSDSQVKEQYAQERIEKDLVYGLVTLESLQVPEPTAEDIKQLEGLKAGLTDPATGAPLSPEEQDKEIVRQLKESKQRELARKKIEDSKAKIKSPADFETVLAADGITVEHLAKYRKGTYPAGIWPSENLQNAVEKLEKDGISGVFDVPKGEMIVKLEAVYPLDEKKFEEEKQAYKDQVESRKAQEKMDEELDKLRDELSVNIDLMKELFPAEK